MACGNEQARQDSVRDTAFEVPLRGVVSSPADPIECHHESKRTHL